MLLTELADGGGGIKKGKGGEEKEKRRERQTDIEIVCIKRK